MREGDLEREKPCLERDEQYLENDEPYLEKEKQFLFWLMQIPGIGPIKLNRYYQTGRSFESLYRMSVYPFQGLYNIEESSSRIEKSSSRREKSSSRREESDLRREESQTIERILSQTDWERICAAKTRFLEQEKIYHTLAERGIQFISIFDESYPMRLRMMEDRPLGLFVRGRLPRENCPTAAIVGARNCSHYGRDMAEYFGRELAKHGIQVVSGLAAGVDGAGHRGALKAGGDTFGVLGCGITTCYPPENYTLYETMMSHGGIVSEYAPGVKPLAGNFPARNRIISGLSDVILIIEAREKSGALITAEFGLEQGKEIFALPGRVTERLSKGCNQLIQSGASILLSVEEVLDYFSLKYDKKLNVYEKNIKGLAKPLKMLYSFLDSEPKCLEEIVKGTGMTVSECVNALMELELQDYITQTANLYYIKNS